METLPNEVTERMTVGEGGAPNPPQRARPPILTQFQNHSSVPFLELPQTYKYIPSQTDQFGSY